MAYCTHSACRTATFVELAYMAVALNRADLLQIGIQLRHDQAQVRCREGRDYADAPLPMPEGV